MFIFPLIYILTFLTALYNTFHKKAQDVFLFIIFGLPIYITALSVSYKIGLGSYIPLFQAFKEILILTAIIILIKNRKEKLVLQTLDKLVLAYLLFSTFYILLPLGNFGFTAKLLALKSLSFFPLIYFTGRMLDPGKVDITKYFHFVCILSILAAMVLVVEVYMNQHLQLSTGYAAFMEHFFGMEPAGNNGLSWTFETANGIKRFASFFGGPLELGTNTLFSISVIAALLTKDDNQIKKDYFVFVAFLMTLLCIIFAFSRASFASYFIIVFIYALITKRKLWLRSIYYGLISIAIFVLFWLKGDIYDLIISTIDFSDTSSAYHIIQWLDGIQAISSNPLGLGLGMSGRVSIESDSNIGGENQLIVIGVQTGIIGILIYVSIYVYTMKLCMKLIRESNGKVRRLAIALLLVKVGLIIPVLTANTESYIYIMYITWICTGLLSSMDAMPIEKKLKTTDDIG